MAAGGGRAIGTRHTAERLMRERVITFPTNYSKMKLTQQALLCSILPMLPIMTKAQGVVELTRQTFDRDTTIVADELRLQDGGRVTVKNGAILNLKTRLLLVLGNFVFDGRGNPGSNGGSPSEWRSSGPCTIGVVGPGEVAHNDWEAAGGHPNDRGSDGGNGGNGASIFLKYKTLAGVNSPVEHLQFLTSGGAAGVGGSGRRLVCGCHPSEHVKYGPKGNDGTKGTDGQYRLTIE